LVSLEFGNLYIIKFFPLFLAYHHHLSSSHDHDHLSIFNVVNIIQTIHPSDVYNIINGQEKGRRYDDDDCDDDEVMMIVVVMMITMIVIVMIVIVMIVTMMMMTIRCIKAMM